MPKPKNRYLYAQILKDLNQKMVFLAGPRQVGKTTLSKTVIAKQNGAYFNWDLAEHRKRILKNEIPLTGLVVFDEIHKYRAWRNFLKGVFDVYRDRLKILVTGSARLDHYRRGGDSLQGRYHMLRLQPLPVNELKLSKPSDLAALMAKSGFPEPYFAKAKTASKRWSNEYRQRLIYEDVRSLEDIVDLGKLELLMLHIPECVGSTLSLNSLREDLEVSFKAVKHWVAVLEKLCYIYRIPPFASKKLRALKKEQKAYLYDWSLPTDRAAQFENLVAGHLIKWVHYQQDVLGERFELHYFRDVDKREVDFVVTLGGKPVQAIECKLTDDTIWPPLKYFKQKFPEVQAIQLCLEPKREYARDGVEVRAALGFLRGLV